MRWNLRKGAFTISGTSFFGMSISPTIIHLAAPSWPARLSALTPASDRAGDDRQNGPTGGGYDQLAYDGAIVNAAQGWDQGLED